MTSSPNDTTQSDLVMDLAAGKLSTLLATLALNESLQDRNQTAGNAPRTSPGPGQQFPDDSSIMTKIWLLLLITAAVLVLSYKFVLRLFLGYADRKDDAVPDGFSDDDDDSAVVKRSMELDSCLLLKDPD